MQLGLPGVALAIGVEQRQEGVLVELFQHQLGLPGLLEQPRQCGLPHADRPFDGQKDPGRRCCVLRQSVALI
jgi:hypothetical protein